MRKRTLWLGLSLLLVAALVLTGCPAPVEEEPVVEEPVVEEPVVEEPVVEEPVVAQPVPGEPQYGGTLTVMFRSGATVGTPDAHEFVWPGMIYYAPILERILMGRLEEKGPRGTGEIDFRIEGMALQAGEGGLTGLLAESWEVTSDTITLHIRPGVYWSGMSVNPVMDAREYTAHDYVFNIERRLEPGRIGRAGHLLAADFIADINATDRYTVVIDTTRFAFNWYSILVGIWGHQIPPEVAEAGAEDWENMVGTGPFYVKEHVPGSYNTYARNPDYWRKTTIDGKDYQLPFVDELVMPVIPDMTTAIAAIRTATVDIHLWLDDVFVESLDKTTPELMKTESPVMGWHSLRFRNDQPPFDDVNVRRALFIGTDRKAIVKAVMGIDLPGPIYWPIYPGLPGFVPVEDLPTAAALLLDYDVALAKKMLADAGYPDGFKMDMLVVNRPFLMGIAEMLSGIWEEDFGIEVTIGTAEEAVMGRLRAERLYKHSLLDWGHGGFQVLETGDPFNFSMYSNPYLDEQSALIPQTVDPAERDAMGKELSLIVIADAPYIPFAYPGKWNYWWPWVKNYFGESSYVVHNPPYDLMWLDLDLKAEMGY